MNIHFHNARKCTNDYERDELKVELPDGALENNAPENSPDELEIWTSRHFGVVLLLRILTTPTF